MPAQVAGEERARRRLGHMVERFCLLRGNWEVDYPDMVEGVLAMVAGEAPLPGPYVAVAADHSYAFIELFATEEEALECLACGASDELYPKCPVALADLAEGSIHEVSVSVSRAGAAKSPTWEVPRC